MAKLNIYLAGRYGRRLEIKGYADQLRAAGHTVTSRWLDSEHAAFDAAPTWEQMLDWAENDLSDINDADVFVAFTESPDSPFARGGRHVEFGYALATGKYMIVVGPCENIFCVQHNARYSNFKLLLEDAKRPNFTEEF